MVYGKVTIGHKGKYTVYQVKEKKGKVILSGKGRFNLHPVEIQLGSFVNLFGYIYPLSQRSHKL